MAKIKLPSWKPSPQAFSQTLDDEGDDDDLWECVYVFRRNSKETEIGPNPDFWCWIDEDKDSQNLTLLWYNRRERERVIEWVSEWNEPDSSFLYAEDGDKISGFYRQKDGCFGSHVEADLEI